jgi:hypothetical protein
MGRNRQPCDQKRRYDEAGRVEGERRSGAEPPDHATGHSRGEDLDEAASRPGDGVGSQPLVLARERRQDRLDGRIEERRSTHQTGCNQIHVPDALGPQQREHQGCTEEVRADQDAPAVEAVDDDACDWSQKQDGDDLDRGQAGHRHSLSGELEDQYHEGDVVERVAEARQELSQPQREVGTTSNDVDVRARDSAESGGP